MFSAFIAIYDRNDSFPVLFQTRIDVYASRFPSSTSSKSLLHYGQVSEIEKTLYNQKY